MDAAKDEWLLETIASDPLNEYSLPQLAEQVSSPSGILPFVGAGLSIPLGFPGWTRFLQKEAARYNTEVDKEVHHLLTDGKYEEAAELLRQRLGYAEFEDALEREFGEDKLPQEIPEECALCRIPLLTRGPVITTNFDRTLERAFELAKWPFPDKVWGSGADLLTRVLLHDRHVLLKMHGDVLVRTDRVLTLAEYESHYGSGKIDFDRPLPKSLKRVFESRPVLFVGCSLNKDRTLKVLHEVVVGANVRHYAIVEKPANSNELEERRTYLSDHGIRTIWFPAGEYQSVAVIVSHLAVKVKDSPISLPAERKPSVKIAAAQAAGAAANERTQTAETNAAAHFWCDKAWDISVHDQLDERFMVYLIRARPYERESVVRELDKFKTAKGFGTIRAYQLAGNWDLLLSVWLPASFVGKFEEGLRNCIPNAQAAFPFSAAETAYRWYGRPGDIATRRQLLAELEGDTIEAVQAGNLPLRYEQLLKTGLVIERPQLTEVSIPFFIAINFQQHLGFNEWVNVVKEIVERLPTYDTWCKRVAVDRGHGFCQLLIRGQSSDYFAIATLSEWVSHRFRPYGAITETFLSQQPSYIYGDHRIGPATFSALRGRDLFVQSLLPELYPKRALPVYEQIEAFVQNARELRQAGAAARLLSRDFLLAILEGKGPKAASVLFTLFFEWEGYLRDNHQEFIGRMGKKPHDVYRDAKVDERNSSHLTLVDLLQVFSHAVRGCSEAANIGSDWGSLTESRNYTIHNKGDLLQEWPRVLQDVLDHWVRINSLIDYVESVTNKVFNGSYRDNGKSTV